VSTLAVHTADKVLGYERFEKYTGTMEYDFRKRALVACVLRMRSEAAARISVECLERCYLPLEAIAKTLNINFFHVRLACRTAERPPLVRTVDVDGASEGRPASSRQEERRLGARPSLLGDLI